MTRPAPSPFLVRVVPPEWSPAERAVLESTLVAASRRLIDAGTAIRFMRFIPGGSDRRGAACLFEAESLAAVRRLLEIAQVPASRIEAFGPVVGSIRHGASGGGAPTP